MSQRIIVAVDGPAGAGKGTICRAVAIQFAMAYLDTGALYRAVALHAMALGREDADELAAWAANMPLTFRGDGHGQFLAWLEQEEVTLALRQESTGDVASRISALTPVRQALLAFQRRYGHPAPAILDGRDVGTVVWPEATLKVFLTANLEERAKRRALELQERGEVANFQEILGRMAQRDARDANRAHAPLRPADDAVLVDTTHLSREECIQRVTQLVGCLFPNPGAT